MGRSLCQRVLSGAERRIANAMPRKGSPLLPRFSNLSASSLMRVAIHFSFSLLSAVFAGTSLAEDDRWLETVKGLHPYAAMGYTDDSNLLRKSDAAAALLPGIPANRSDKYLTIEAGLDTELELSRQRILINGRIYNNSYDRFDQLDHTAGDARAVWKWTYGNLWGGNLGYAYSRKMRDFTNQLIPAKDMLDRHRLFASVDRWLTTRWRASANTQWTDVSSSETRRLDKKRAGVGFSVDHFSGAGNSLGLETTYANSSYDIGSERDYDDWYLGPTAHWQITTKTTLDANGGYLRREHDGLSERDFDGFVGRLTALWQITDKTTLSASAWRDLSNLDDEIADYAVIDGIVIEPTWAITPKTAVRGLVRYEHRDFQTSSEVPGIPDRIDEINTLGLWFDWQFLRNGSLSLGYETEDRDSTRRLEEYDYDLFRAQLRIGL